MTLWTNNAEGGTNGAAVPTSSDGSGDPWSTVAAGSGAITYDNANAYKGTYGITIAPASASERCWLGWTPGTAPTKQAIRFYMNLSSLPSASFEPFRIHNVAMNSSRTSLVVNGVGTIRISNNAGGYVNAFGGASTSSGALSAGTWYRFEIDIDVSGGSAAGILNIDVYLGDSLTPISGLSGSITGAGFATNLPMTMFGRTATITDTAVYHFDDLAIDTGTTTRIGPTASGVTVSSGYSTGAAAANQPRAQISVTPATA